MAKKRSLFSFLLLNLSLFLGFGLRIYQLGAESLWKDEIFSLIRSSRPFSEIILEKFPYGARAPLHHLFIHLALLFNNSEFAVRLPGVILGVFSLFIIYRIAVVLFDDQRVGALAAFLLAISPLHLRYSREARFYVYLVFFSGLSLLFLLKFFRGKRWRWFFYFAVVAFLSLATHLTALLILLPQFGFLAIVFFKKRNLSFNWFKKELINNKKALALSLVFLLFLTILVVVFIWSFKLLFANIVIKPARPFPEFVSYVSENLAGSQLAAPLYWLFFIIGYFSYLKKMKPEANLLLFLTLFPPFFLYFVRAWSFGFHIRYVIFILIPFLLMISYGLVRLLRRNLKIFFVVAVFILLSIQPIRVYYQTSRGDWRGVGAYIQENARKGDVVVAESLHNKILVDYYLRSAEYDLILKTAAESLEPKETPFRIYYHQHDYVTRPERLSNLEEVPLIDYEGIVSFDPKAKISPMYLFVSRPVWAWQEAEDEPITNDGWGISEHYGRLTRGSDYLKTPEAEIAYKITIPKNGDYDLYANLRWDGARSLLKYKIDNQAWSTGFQPSYGQEGSLAFYWQEKKLGNHYLTQGKHTISFLNTKLDNKGRYQTIDYFYLSLNE